MKEIDFEKRNKFNGILMIVIGAIFWFFIDTTSSLIQDILKGLGIFLFLYGIINLNNLDKKKSDKAKLIHGIIIFFLLVLLVLLVLFLSKRV
tara:strand:+ start:1605 stop:1880 length:276 start_codon:yes stop_codon:yes gene_type:complete